MRHRYNVPMHDESEGWMAKAIALAERGRGFVEPNPLVGAIVVKDGRVVGEGWHAKFGAAHAEIGALTAAGEQARGATLYVTLEPCRHHGKTPPCADAVIRAGIARVVAAIEDPFPEVAGRGAAQLRDAGIRVEFGPGAPQARRQNAPYLTLLANHRPHVHGKWAMSLDGKIATAVGESQWISGEESRAVVHQLRGRMDGILVGVGTALADDPLLTARPAGPRTPTRVVLDRSGRLPATSRLLRTAREVPTLIALGAAADDAVFRHAGCETIRLAEDGRGRLAVPQLLAELGRRRWTNLLVEGGGQVMASFLEAGLLDELHVFIAPKLIGGGGAPSPIAGDGVARLADAMEFDAIEIALLGSDVHVHASRR